MSAHTAITKKSFKPLKIYSLKPALKPPVTRANGDAVSPIIIGCVAVEPLIAGGNPLATHSTGRRLHVQAYCTFFRRRF